MQTGRPEIAGSAPTVAEVAAALRVPPSAVGGPTRLVQTMSVARAMTIVPLIGEDVLDSLQPDFPVLEARIAQGLVMGRPSLITASLPDANGEIWVGGRAEPLGTVPEGVIRWTYSVPESVEKKIEKPVLPVMRN